MSKPLQVRTLALWVLVLLPLTSATSTTSNQPPETDNENVVCTDSPCEYHFDVRWQRTMTYLDQNTGTTYNVALATKEEGGSEEKRFKIVSTAVGTGTEDGGKGDEDGDEEEGDDGGKSLVGTFVSARDVISGDGHQRSVITINGKFPGPEIHVMEGVEVIVHVHNNLGTDGLTLHWHGMHQAGTQWMDGVAYVTQCPLSAGSVPFSYRYRAEPAGTHWYHPHFSNMRDDGMYGALIVHRQLPTDITPRMVPLILSDLYKYTATDVLLMTSGVDEMEIHKAHLSGHHHHSLEPQKHNALINGRGRPNFTDNGTSSTGSGDLKLPLAVFTLDPNKPTRFNAIHAGADFAYKVSIDGHILKILAMDGFDIEPVSVDMFYMYPGESLDFEVKKQGEGTTFWIRMEETMLHEANPGHEHNMEQEEDPDDPDSHHHHHHHVHVDGDKEYVMNIHPKGGVTNESLEHSEGGNVTYGHHKRDTDTDYRDEEGKVHFRKKREMGDGGMGHMGHSMGDMEEGTEGHDTAGHSTSDAGQMGSMHMMMHMVQGRAILVYTDDPNYDIYSTPDPTTSPRSCDETHYTCMILNCAGPSLTTGEDCVLVSDLKGSETTNQETWDKLNLGQKADMEIVLNFMFSGKSNATGSSVNGKKFILPKAPLYQHPPGLLECSAHPNETYCTNIAQLPANKIVDVIFANMQGDNQSIYSHHPIHMHGHSYAVLGVGYPTWHEGKWEDAEGVICLDKYCTELKHTHLHSSKRKRKRQVKDDEDDDGEMQSKESQERIQKNQKRHRKSQERSQKNRGQSQKGQERNQESQKNQGQSQKIQRSQRRSKRHTPTLETRSPILKDTVIVPARGYVVVRILTDNPGFWFLHCHIDQHLINGMGILLDVAPHLDPPVDFPDCSGGLGGEFGAGAVLYGRGVAMWVAVVVALCTLGIGVMLGVAVMQVIRWKTGVSARL